MNCAVVLCSQPAAPGRDYFCSEHSHWRSNDTRCESCGDLVGDFDLVKQIGPFQVHCHFRCRDDYLAHLYHAAE